MTIFLLFFISFYCYVFWIFLTTLVLENNGKRSNGEYILMAPEGNLLSQDTRKQFLEKLAITLLVKLQVVLRELFNQVEKTILIADPILFLLKKRSLSTISGK